MNRIATISVCTGGILLLLLAFRISRPTQNAGNSAYREEERETAEVMPAVSDGWSKLTTRTSETSRSKSTNLFWNRTETNSVSEVDTNDVLSASPVPETIGTRVKDLVAHLALDSVGVDPDAEQYWLAAINDPNLSADERHDLIQGLSEAGFRDPSHVTSDDLPLIVSRIALVEELSQQAIDTANASAFQQTYRDLLNMFASVAEPETPNTQTPSAGAE